MLMEAMNGNKRQLASIITEATSLLRQNKIEEPLREARFLMQEINHISISDQLAKPEILLSSTKQIKFLDAVKKRASGVPTAYILGTKGFYGREFFVENTLIPRPETELLVEAVLELNFTKEKLDIIDVCTGSGCIGITIYLELADRFALDLDLSDISAKALRTCQKNIEYLVDDHSKINIYQADLFPSVNTTYDLIVTNPPYIIKNTLETLDVEVKEFEPHLALDGGQDGLKFYRRIAREIKPFINPDNGSYLFLEHGIDQRQPIKNIFKNSDLTVVDIVEIDDWQGIDRVLGFLIQI